LRMTKHERETRSPDASDPHNARHSGRGKARPKSLMKT